MQNTNGEMDKFLGAIATILQIFGGDYATIEEDEGDCPFQEGGHWCWNAYCFDYIVEDSQDDFDASSENEILSFIFQ